MEIQNKELFKLFNILYVEDDEVVRTELSQILSTFFSNVFVATDGVQALEIFKSEKIDIIISDINMPNLNGISMLKEIRKIDEEIPVIFCTAYLEHKFLLDAIKLNVHDYLIKPINLRELFSNIRRIALNLYKTTIINQSNYDLQKLRDIIDSINIVIKTDTNMNITYVNELFCQISGYEKDELIGKSFNDLKHPDSSIDIYNFIYESVSNEIPWSGILKSIGKNESNLITDCYMVSSHDDLGNFTGCVSIQKDITEELNKKREIQLALMKDKTDIFRKSKEGNIEQLSIINELKMQLEKSQSDLNKAVKSIDRLIFDKKKKELEFKSLKTELDLLKKNSGPFNKINLLKNNNDLKNKLNKIENKYSFLEEVTSKEINALKNFHNNNEEELKQKINELEQTLKSMKNDEVLVEKLDYWKEKAETQTAKLDNLEKKIIDMADSKLLSKLFE